MFYKWSVRFLPPYKSNISKTKKDIWNRFSDLEPQNDQKKMGFVVTLKSLT